MANSPQAAKRARQNEKNRLRNRAVKSSLHTLDKKLAEAIAAGDAEKIKTINTKLSRTLDVAASKGILHTKTASRKKSRNTLRVNKKIGGGK